MKSKAQRGVNSSFMGTLTIAVAIIAVVATLTKRQQQIFYARLVEEQSLRQVAKLLGVSSKTVSKEVTQLEAILREGIKVWILACEGNPHCSDLPLILAKVAWDGEHFSEALRDRLFTHIGNSQVGDNCGACRERIMELLTRALGGEYFGPTRDRARAKERYAP